MLNFIRRYISAIAVEKNMCTTEIEAKNGNWAYVAKLCTKQDLLLSNADTAGWGEQELLDWLKKRGNVSGKWFSEDESYAEWLCDECCSRGYMS